MATFTMKYNKERQEFDISKLPEVVLDLIIDSMWDKPEVKWISELLADEEATALAEAGVMIVDD